MKTLLLTIFLSCFFPLTVVEGEQPPKLPLIDAVKTCNYAQVNVTIKLVPDVDQADEYGKTALHYAVVCGNPEIVSLLLLYRANPIEADKQGMTPLDYALLFEHTAIVQLLLNRELPKGVQAM